MIYIPAIYFLLLFIYILKKNGFDISACIISVYLLTSLCSIIIYNDFDTYKYGLGIKAMDLDIIPTIIYCGMVTLVTIPFIRFNSNKKRMLKSINPSIFNFLSLCFICSFFFCLFLFKDDLIYRITMGNNIGDMRGAEVVTAQNKLNGIIKVISTIAVSICSVSVVCLILFFYSVTFLKKPWWFNGLILLSSVGCIIQGIMGIDRSIAFYWILNSFFIFIFFRPYLSRKTKRIIIIFALIALVGLASYLAMLSFSRFGDRAFNALIGYMGQNYTNFCWFWNRYEAPEMNWGIFCPITSRFFIDWGYPVSAYSYGFYVQSKVGYFVNVFYTFMGTIMLYLGQWAVIPFCIIYNIIASFILRHKKVLSISTILLIFIIAIIPYDGVILYLLVDYIKAFGFWFIIAVCLFINSNKIIKLARKSKVRGLGKR